MVLRSLPDDLFNHSSVEADPFVRILMIEQREANTRVSPDVRMLDPSDCRIDQYVFTVGVDPYRRHVSTTIFVDCSQEGEVLPFQEPPDFHVKFGHARSRKTGGNKAISTL